MQIAHNLQNKCKIEFNGAVNRRAHLLQESLIRQAYQETFGRPIRWSPISVMEYVEQSSPSSTMAKEVAEYRRYLRVNQDIDFGVD